MPLVPFRHNPIVAPCRHVASCSPEDAGENFFDESFGGGGHEFGAGDGAAADERFFVTDGNHAAVDGHRIGEFASLGREGLRVAVADLKIPVYAGLVISSCSSGGKIGVSLVLFRPPALAGTMSGSLICFAW